MTSALDTQHLGKRYRHTWALRDCTVQIPSERVAALVGPNGAGKTTLLHLAVGLLSPTEGTIEVAGHSPTRQTHEVLSRVGFVAQEHPLYRSYTVGEILTFSRHMNTRWDQAHAEKRLRQLGIALHQRVGKLSGGQRAQVALAIALAKRPEALLLDEPVASLDPLARRDFLSVLMEAVATEGITAVLSSHNLADLERVSDFLVILSTGQVRLAGEITTLLTQHKWLSGPREYIDALASHHHLITASYAEREVSVVVRLNGNLFDSNWQEHPLSLEDLVLAYLAQQRVVSADPVELAQEGTR